MIPNISFMSFIPVFWFLVMAVVNAPALAGSPPPTPTATQCLAVVDVSSGNEFDGCAIHGVNLAPGECELYGTCKTFWRLRSDGHSESTLPSPLPGRTGCASKKDDRTDTQVRFTCTTTSNTYSPDTTAEAQNCDGRLRVGSC